MEMNQVDSFDIKRIQSLIFRKAVCDMPAAYFAEELVQAYPDAKVILTIRDVDKWHK